MVILLGRFIMYISLLIHTLFSKYLIIRRVYMYVSWPDIITLVLFDYPVDKFNYAIPFIDQEKK